MSLSDPISNILTSIRNAVHAKKETLDVPASRLAQEILRIFKSDGYIEDFRLLKDNVQGTLKIYLNLGIVGSPHILLSKRFVVTDESILVTFKPLA